ncbi:cyclin-dependent kinase 2-associated protein 1-like [Nycticebus coucang]|uniref:cyclin-dependent kinase 2-associated protein 1-like n=1 Tax=Nycticebus coucang TaxID=9470 RepID=UPI00234DEBD0|nr:cyclin-dependent kinase 2-associated protein 1-like [Nycticebus coucang]
MGDILRQCQGEGWPYLPVWPEPSTTKSAWVLGGLLDAWPRHHRPCGLAWLRLAHLPPGRISYKPNLTAHMPAAALNAAGSVHSPSISMATSSQYRQLLSDYGPPSLGYSQGTGNSQVPQSKYVELLAIIEELGKEIRPTYAGSKSAMERLKCGIIHARGLVRECLAETEWNARS